MNGECSYIEIKRSVKFKQIKNFFFLNFIFRRIMKITKRKIRSKITYSS